MKLQYISQRRQLIKSFYAGIGKTAVIFPSAFLTSLGIGIIFLGIVFYMMDVFNATPSQIGGLASLWALCYISGCIFIRPLFDRFLPRYTIAAAAFCMWAATLLIPFVNSIVLVYILYGLFGFSSSLFWPHLMAWLSRKVEGDRLSRTISKFNFSWSAGTIISPFLAGRLSEISPQLPLYIGSSFCLLTGSMMVGAILALPAIRNDKETEHSSKVSTCGKGKNTPVRYPAWVGLFTTYAVMGMVLVIFPVYARDDLSISKSVIGLLLLSRALFMTIGFIVLGRTVFWHFKTLPMISGQVCLAVLLVLMDFFRSPLFLWFILAAMGLLMALSYSSSIFHGVSGSINRAKRMATHEAFIAAGCVIGYFLGGILYERYSMSAVYWFCFGLVLAGVIVQALLFLWSRNYEKQS